jgi:hypothetical protein
VTDFWRRQALESELLRGSTFAGGGFFGETSPGRIADSAVFECDPCSEATRSVRIAVQARTGVDVRTKLRLPRSDVTQTLDWRDNISFAASGGHSDQHYFWVQIFSEYPERLRGFSGRTWEEDVGRDNEGVDIDSGFRWSGRRWFVDTNRTDSARYPLSRPTTGSPNCETVYDAPTSQLGLEGVMNERREIARVEKTTAFHTFLFSLPLDPIEARTTYLPHRAPVASIAWSRDEALERARPEDRGQLVLQRYRVHYIHPNGSLPPSLTRVLWRTFHGR